MIYFVTTNRKKFEEAKEIIPILEFYPLELKEIQSDNLEEIVKEKARQAYEIIKKPLVVEDSGLFIKALNGFPGPYSSYVYKTIGIRGILKLMEGVENREAVFKCCVAYVNEKGEIFVFTGEVEGYISYEPRGERGFGFDPIFIPKGYDKTFAEDYELKKKLSHRKKAFEKLKEFLNL